MPENRPPEDVQPLARPVHEQGLARPLSMERGETTHAKEEEREARWVEGGQEEKGLIGRAIDKVDEVRHKARNKLADK